MWFSQEDGRGEGRQDELIVEIVTSSLVLLHGHSAAHAVSGRGEARLTGGGAKSPLEQLCK